MTPAPPSEDLPPPALEVACQSSTAEWQLHLEQLFNNAGDRFPDVVWELMSEGDTLPVEEVWGHKAIVYARAPPTFQARYFSFRPPPVASPSPYSASPAPVQSAVSLGAASLGLDAPSPARSPSPGSALRASSPAPTISGQVLRLTTTIASALFSQELEYLYTGKTFGDAFEFLFDSPEKRDEGDGEKNRLEKLRKDLVFMWRSRLYSDVRIQLTGFTSSSSISPGDPSTAAVFSSHRFILVSRSPYFRTQLLGSFAPPTPAPGQPLTLSLPSPPFTPASLHFTLGFIYTGTLSFSHRTYDLETAFHIMRAATYLSIITLYNEIEARIIEDMMHNLFHAYMSFNEYEKLTGGKWSVGGCKCRQCARRAPRVLEFAVLEDIKNDRLANGARRALVGLFGDGWCTSELATLSQKTRETLLRGVQKRTVPLNVFPLLYAAQHAMTRLNPVMDSWAHTVREMVLSARKAIDELMCEKAEECFEQAEWLSVMDADGGRFEDGEKVEWVMDCLRRGLNEKNAGLVYQTLVSSILLRPHPQDPNATVLSNTSIIRQQVELTRMDVIKWMRKRWLGVQQEGGFDDLEGWAIKEISHELEVPVEDLMRPPTTSPTKGPPTWTGLRPTIGKPEGDGDTASMTPLRASVLNRNLVKSSTKDTVVSSTSSVRSVARSVASTTSRASGRGTTSRARPPAASSSASTSSLRAPSLTASLRSQSQVSTSSSQTPASHASPASSLLMPSQAASVRPPTQTSRKSRPTLSTVSSRKSVASSVTHSERPKSVAASVDSVRSHASTIRKAGTPVVESSTSSSRPSSTISAQSDTSTAFKTARSDINTSATPRSSIASTASGLTAGRQPIRGGGQSKSSRPRRGSNASTASAASSIASTASTAQHTKRAVITKPPPVPKRPTSTASVRSNVSTTNRVAAAKAAAAKAVEKRESIGKPPAVPKKTAMPKIVPTTADKGKGKAPRVLADNKSDEPPTPSTSTTGSASTARAANIRGIHKRESIDTITDSTTTTTPATPRPPKPMRPPPKEPAAPSPQPPTNLGATLNIGIPCIISSKRNRFRAFARYIGELEGECGPWVGVEVPLGEGWSSDKLEGRQWNDGTWGGRKYFDIGAGMEWDESEERRKRRKEGSGGLSRDRTLKREGEQLGVDRSKRLRSLSPAVSDASTTTESRGLFVRPQQVIYVVDAEPDY